MHWLEDGLPPIQDHMPFALHRETFSRDLHTLRHLQTLQLRLRGRMGMPADGEERAIARWIQECQRHRSLRDIFLWTEVETMGHAGIGRVRAWSRIKDGIWVKKIDRQGQREDGSTVVV